MAGKKYPPGSIGAQLQAKGVPEDEWGGEVQRVRGQNAENNARARAATKSAKRATKNIARGLATASPRKLAEGVGNIVEARKQSSVVKESKRR